MQSVHILSMSMCVGGVLLCPQRDTEVPKGQTCTTHIPDSSWTQVNAVGSPNPTPSDLCTASIDGFHENVTQGMPRARQ